MITRSEQPSTLTSVQNYYVFLLQKGEINLAKKTLLEQCFLDVANESPKFTLKMNQDVKRLKLKIEIKNRRKSTYP